MAARDIASLIAGLLILLFTWGAWAIVDVNVEDRVEVFQGENAQIACMFTSAEETSDVVIQWFYLTKTGQLKRIYYQHADTKMVEQGTPFTDRLNTSSTDKEVVLTLTDVQLKDEVDFICRVQSQADGSGEGRTRLHVFVTPDGPTVEGVQTGISVNEPNLSKIGTCEVKNGFPKPNVTWYRNNVPLHNEQNVVRVNPRSTIESSGLFSMTSELSMKVALEDKDAQFYCEIVYLVPGGRKMIETKRINITVYYASTEVSFQVVSPKDTIKEGDTVEFHCNGNGNDPSSVYTIKYGEDDTSVESNVLVLNNVNRLNNGVYTCYLLDIDTYEEISQSTTLYVNYLDPAVVMPKDTVEVAQNEELNVSCNALSSLQTQTEWFKDGEIFSVGNILRLENADYDTAGNYECVVRVPQVERMETSGTLTVYVKTPPKIMMPENTDIEESFDNMVTLKCSVRGFPPPTVIWTSPDAEVTQTPHETLTEDSVLSVVSIKVKSDFTAFCNASNNHGSDAVAFNVRAITHTTISATTTSTIIPSTVIHTSASSTTTSTSPATTVKAETSKPEKKSQKEGSGVIIAVVIIFILLLAILGSVLYFLYKKGKLCGRSGKKEITKENSNKDNIVVEMKSDNTEEAVLLGVNGEKQPPNNQ